MYICNCISNCNVKANVNDVCLDILNHFKLHEVISIIPGKNQRSNLRNNCWISYKITKKVNEYSLLAVTVNN